VIENILSGRDIFATAVANAWEDIIWGVAAIVLRWRLGGRPESALAQSAVGALCQGRSRDDNVSRSWADSNRFQSLFFSLIRPVIAGGRFAEEGYAEELSKALSGIDQLNEPDHFPGSSFRPKWIHRRDDLRFCFEILLLVSIDKKKPAPSINRIDRYLDLIEDGLGDPGFCNLVGLLNDLRTDVGNDTKVLFQTLLGEIADGIDYDAASAALIDYLDVWIKPINERREKCIRSQEVSAEKLEEIRRVTDSALSDRGEDVSPFQPAVRRTRETAQRRIFSCTGVQKTDLVDGPLASSPSGLAEHMASLVAQHAKQLALREAFGGGRGRQTLTAEAYREALIGEAGRIRDAGFTPMLLVQSRKDPTWLSECLETSGAPTTRHGRICGQIEGIDVLRSRWPKAGTSLLIARERLTEIFYEEDDIGRIVRVRFERDELDPWAGTLRFEFGQRVVLADAKPVELVFAEPSCLAGASTS
jgi:hypothetical protein